MFYIKRCTRSIKFVQITLPRNSSGIQNSSVRFKGCEREPRSSFFIDDVPVYQIDLNLPPQQRWRNLVEDKKKQMIGLLNSIKENSGLLFGFELFYLVDNYLPYLTRTLPQPYYDELVGISQATNISLGEITLFNVFYEFFSVCTSIIAQGNNKEMYHGRNLDFGLFLGWDVTNNTWLTTEYLKPLVVKLDFMKDNKTLFRSVNFAGYIGILTAVKKGAFSLTVDERFKLDGGYIGISEWILGYHNQKWMGLLTREVMETADNYKTAQKMLAKPHLIAPVYFILAGSKSDEGCIITRSRTKFDIWNIGEKHEHQNESWYLVQTNYDHWEKPPFFDDRRSPAIHCMEEFGRADPLSTIYNVLSTRPILNKLTTYTALMDVNSGMLQAKLRDCEDPCWPW
ncbi:acid ceramidase-like isoform X2 [Periplaneta americana]|uniref:acid ceramidase-like isoform X2 n=1 Tax=Periplaneta americana TaxID=6978 RepID=UPI0037E85400